MSVREFRTDSAEETIAIGCQIGQELVRPACVLLIGNLGAGKTTLAKGILEGLGAANADEVSSPTFTLIHEFPDSAYHIDLYRLETMEEVRRLGIDDMLDQPRAVVLLEWAERFPALLPTSRWEIRLETTPTGRLIRVAPPGS